MPARLRLALFVTGVLALAGAAGVLLFAVGDRTARGEGFAGALRPPNIPPAEFGLPDERGRVVRLRDLRGRPAVVTFLYTTCRDTCPLTTQQIRAGLDDLGHDVPVIAVSVDPANDTPQRASAFALKQGMTGRMRWVLGSSAQLQRIWNAYGIAPQTAKENHSASTVLLDASGRQRIGFPTSELTPEGLAHDVAALEREQRRPRGRT